MDEDPTGPSSGVRRQRASLGQGRGPDVELIVSGTRVYATYETPDGYPVVYDDDRELYCYARLTAAGAFESSGVPVAEPPPAGVALGASESEAVRTAKIAARLEKLESPDSDRAT